MNSTTELEDYLDRKIKLKDLTKLKYFLGLEVTRSSEGITCQSKYALDILQDFVFLGSKLVIETIEQSLKFSKIDGDILEDPSSYHRMIGRLIYFTITRSNLAYSVQIISQYIDKRRHPHLCCYRILIFTLKYFVTQIGQYV